MITNELIALTVLPLGFSYILSTLFAFMQVNNYPCRPNVMIVTLVSCLLAIAFRVRGWDVALYQDLYNSLDTGQLISGSVSSWAETGYLLLMLPFKWVQSPYVIFQLFYATIVIVLLYAICKRSTAPHVALFLFLLIYLIRFPYGQARQAIVMLLFVWTIHQLVDGRRVIFVLANCIGMTIHGVAALSFLAYPIHELYRRIKNSTRLFRIVFLGSAVVLLFSNNLHYLVVEVASSIDVMAARKLLYYATEKEPVTAHWLTPDTLRIMLVFFTLTTLKKINVDTRMATYIGLYAFGVFLYALLSFNPHLASRTSTFFLVFDFLIVAELMSKMTYTLRLLFFLVWAAFGIAMAVLEFYAMKSQTVLYYWSAL